MERHEPGSFFSMGLPKGREPRKPKTHWFGKEATNTAFFEGSSWLDVFAAESIFQLLGQVGRARVAFVFSMINFPIPLKVIDESTDNWRPFKRTSCRR